jgi:hypothetical protein
MVKRKIMKKTQNQPTLKEEARADKDPGRNQKVKHPLKFGASDGKNAAKSKAKGVMKKW